MSNFLSLGSFYENFKSLTFDIFETMYSNKQKI